MSTQEILLVTGMSGAGKSTVLRTLEDLGWEVVDNLPLLLLDRLLATDLPADAARDRPLALYYFGQDEGEKRRVLDRTISGGATVNDVIFHVSMEDLPFGGIGPSGMGAYHGHDGFRTFSHARAIYTQPKIDVAKLAGLKPPYGKATARAIAQQMKM